MSIWWTNRRTAKDTTYNKGGDIQKMDKRVTKLCKMHAAQEMAECSGTRSTHLESNRQHTYKSKEQGLQHSKQ